MFNLKASSACSWNTRGERTRWTWGVCLFRYLENRWADVRGCESWSSSYKQREIEDSNLHKNLSEGHLLLPPPHSVDFSLDFCLFVDFSAGLHKNYWMNFQHGPKKNPLTFGAHPLWDCLFFLTFWPFSQSELRQAVIHWQTWSPMTPPLLQDVINLSLIEISLAVEETSCTLDRLFHSWPQQGLCQHVEFEGMLFPFREKWQICDGNLAAQYVDTSLDNVLLSHPSLSNLKKRPLIWGRV